MTVTTENQPDKAEEQVTQPVNEMSGKSGRQANSPSPHPVEDPNFPGAKTLLISAKRPRSFLERTARELLAGGTDVIILSALGDAIHLAVQLQNALQEKKAASLIKVETTYNFFGARNYYPASVHTPGIRVYMRKHPDFKGSRISPGYVSFAPNPATLEGAPKFTPIFDAESRDRIVSLNAGDTSLSLGGEGINKVFGSVLEKCGEPLEKFKIVHEKLLEKALRENEGKKESEVRSVQLDNLSEIHPHLKVALCRPCIDLIDKHKSGSLGASFLTTFKTKFPFDREQNMGMIYVVSPNGADFEDKTDFLDAVTATASNVMTTLCDYNGLVRREGQWNEIQRMIFCRVSLFSGGIFRHRQTSKREVAKAILAGLAEGYRHGPAPRINFAYDEDVFRTEWVETTGLEPFASNPNSVESEQTPESQQ